MLGKLWGLSFKNPTRSLAPGHQTLQHPKAYRGAWHAGGWDRRQPQNTDSAYWAVMRDLGYRSKCDRKTWDIFTQGMMISF